MSLPTSAEAESSSDVTPFPIALLVLLIAGLGALFAPTIVELAAMWLSDPNYTHGVAILPISIVFAYRHIRKTGIPATGEPVFGGASILAGCIIHLVAVILNLPPVDFLAMIFVLRGACVAIGGRQWASGFTFPILFLFFMFPLPVVWSQTAALFLQGWVANLSMIALKPFILAIRHGNEIIIPGADSRLFVAEECSGLRQIVAFLALAAFVSYWTPRPGLYCVLLMIVAVPVAIVANVLRIFLMAVGVKYLGSDWLAGWMHDIPALVTIPIGLLMFLGVGLLIHRILSAGAKAEVTP